MSRLSLISRTRAKVKNRSGFDKSYFNALTANVGSLVPLVKQFVIPGNGSCSVDVSASLPPLASDAFLRSHLKLEAFYVPLRILYGGFQSWFAKELVAQHCPNSGSRSTQSPLTTAELPYFTFTFSDAPDTDASITKAQAATLEGIFGPGSLMDYFGFSVRPLYKVVPGDSGSDTYKPTSVFGYMFGASGGDNGAGSLNINMFPHLAYQMIYHYWYRNKSIQRPLFAPSTVTAGVSYRGNSLLSSLPWHNLSHLGMDDDKSSGVPFVSFDLSDFDLRKDISGTLPNPYTPNVGSSPNTLLNGSIFEVRQRNYGYDYFTTCLPSPQLGDPMSVSVDSGAFSISSLRAANALQHFAELNNVAGPDYVQFINAVYGKQPSAAAVQKPLLLGSKDIPIYTSALQQTAPGSGADTASNPFSGVAAQFGRASGGSKFSFSWDVDEPGYIMVLVSFVPEAVYSYGLSYDMHRFLVEGSTPASVPNSDLEQVGYEPVIFSELSGYVSPTFGNPGNDSVFGYQPRFMWHKFGNKNQVHGLFRAGESLASFVVNRDNNISFKLDDNGGYISDAFLRVSPNDLDNVTAVAGWLSQYGVMIDSYINLKVSEPLGESVMPSLADPAYDDGHSVYLKRGGVSVND